MSSSLSPDFGAPTFIYKLLFGWFWSLSACESAAQNPKNWLVLQNPGLGHWVDNFTYIKVLQFPCRGHYTSMTYLIQVRARFLCRDPLDATPSASSKLTVLCFHSSGVDTLRWVWEVPHVRRSSVTSLVSTSEFEIGIWIDWLDLVWNWQTNVTTYTVGCPLSRDVLFSFGSSGYQLGCTVAAVSAQ